MKNGGCYENKNLVGIVFVACFPLGMHESSNGRRSSVRKASLYLRATTKWPSAIFIAAAQRDPNYVYATGSSPKQGVWSYVGRSEYLTGRFPQARQTLEQALAANREEDIARLYLGLTLAAEGDRQRGLKEIEDGMRGISNFLDYINQAQRFSIGQYWDPGRDIRSAIQSDLAMISGRDLDWQRLIADTEWLGIRMEQESDLARRQEAQARSRDSNGRGDR